MKWNVKPLLLAATIAGIVVGCENKTEQTASPKGSATPEAASSVIAATSAAKPPEPPPPVPEKPKSLPVNDFLAKLTPTTCSWIDRCKNEKFKALTSTMGMLVASFGALGMGKPELGNSVKAIGKAMDAEKRAIPNKQECETIGGVTLQVLGISQDVVEPKLGKTVQYDGEKAVACLDGFEKPIAACETEFKFTGKVKLAQISSMEKEFKADLDAQQKACEEVFTGLVEAGAACEYDIECKGAESKCKGRGKSKKCVAGKPAKK